MEVAIGRFLGAGQRSPECPGRAAALRSRSQQTPEGRRRCVCCASRYAVPMRTHTFDTIVAGESDDLLTTGEAAALLGSSRQHVVDLCDRGELAFSTLGTHRRVVRRDVEALRSRTRRLTRDQRRSLWLAHAVAGRIVEDPESAVAIARSNLAKLRAAARGQAKRWLDEWERLLGAPVEVLLTELTSTSPKGRELRQNSPFAGVLDQSQRLQVLEAWRRHEHGHRP